jgi:prepilin-type N-terminal cleavage/methylation domain-containing protein
MIASVTTFQRRNTGRHGATCGMTLVEMLVAMAASLLLMSAIAQLFGVLGRTVSDSANVQSLNMQLRGVARLLRQDLDGATADTLPPLRGDGDAGYFEIIEGNARDYDASQPTLIQGDCDDVLLFTTRTADKPFIGRFNTTSTIVSQAAEVAWFCVAAGSDPVTNVPLYTLYRRMLLCTAYVGVTPFQSGNAASWSSYNSWSAFYNAFDLSCRRDGTLLIPNSLGDLTKRENRFLHSPTFPHEFQGSAASGAVLSGAGRVGDDIVLTNVIAFDVRVYDPAVSGTGDYVDLNSEKAGSAITTTGSFPAAGKTAFQGRGVYPSSSGTGAGSFSLPTYDTWSTHYECDGQNQGDAPSLTVAKPAKDEGSNNQDDNDDGVVDDAGERETSPPYPVPLRGLEVRIRVYEPSSRQVRQVTVRHTFVPH